MEVTVSDSDVNGKLRPCALASLRNPEVLRGLDPAVPADVARFRMLWAEHSMLHFKLCDLRIFLIGRESLRTGTRPTRPTLSRRTESV